MIEVWCDGGSRGNPGHSAWGFLVKVKGRITKKGRGYLGIATNNVAEYTAVVAALGWLAKEHPGENLAVYLDSQLAVRQLAGLYKVKNAKLRQLIFQIRELETSFSKIFYSHVSRSENKEADRLVNRQLDEVIYGT